MGQTQPRQHFDADDPRGMFILLPLKYSSRIPLRDLDPTKVTSPLHADQVAFNSQDFIQLMNDKCRSDGNFVKRWTLDLQDDAINVEQSVPFAFTNFQLFIFNNGIAFLSVYLAYTNADAKAVYDFLQPAYNSETQAELRKSFVDAIESHILARLQPEMSWFTDYGADDIRFSDLITKEAYRMNVAYSPTTFESTDAIAPLTYNLHRMIDLNRDFTDPSEHDVAYVTGGKNVKTERYGWGCAITSQELSFVYAQSEERQSLPERANDDLLLLMLTMYQRYESMNINEKIHARYADSTQHQSQSIRQLKQEALNLIAYETLAPTQISRWNNVCEIYSALLDLTGVDETIAEIKDKVLLLTDEQDRRDATRDNAISMVITVFGLVSIIAAILQTVDYLDSRSPVMWISFVGSLVAVLVFGMYLGIRLVHKKG